MLLLAGTLWLRVQLTDQGWWRLLPQRALVALVPWLGDTEDGSMARGHLRMMLLKEELADENAVRLLTLLREGDADARPGTEAWRRRYAPWLDALRGPRFWEGYGSRSGPREAAMAVAPSVALVAPNAWLADTPLVVTTEIDDWLPATAGLSLEPLEAPGLPIATEALAALPNPPKVLVAASAIGFYGSRGPEAIDEATEPGRGFLPETCVAWEEATKPAEVAGIRVVHLRIGLVLAAAGGVLAKLRTPFSLGLGGPVGSGRQGMSWISLDDLLGAVVHCVRDASLSGPVNAVSPDPRSNADFGRALGRVMRRPAIAPLPAPVVGALFGEMGRELLLRGAFVQPRRLLERGFRFEHARLEQALAFELGRVED